MATPAPVFDPQAVIEGRRPGRVRVGLIVGTILAALCAIVALGIDVLESVASGHSVLPFVVALPLALVPVPLLIAVILFLDRLEPEPRANLVFAFIWGAGVAALFAALFNTAGMVFITQPALGATTGEYVSATAGAPVIEETLKGLVLVGLMWWRRQELDGPTDGVIYAAMVGLGFAMMENIGYYMNALVNPVHGGAQLLGYTFVLRGVASPLLHPIFTSMTGIGAAYAASHRHAWWALPAGWVGAVLLHATWNGLSVLGLPGLVLAYAILACAGIAIIVVIVADRRRIVRLITHCLPGYERTGLISAGDIAMLATLRGRRRARNWARAAGGLPAAAAMSDYQLAATELALLHQKSARRVISDDRFAQRQHDLLGLMQVARGVFLRRSPQPPEAPWAGPGSSGFTRQEAFAAPVPRPVSSWPPARQPPQ